ncbi:hypothetical protein ACFQY5_19125 [Paeniroseomonas aquatica]|uniref:hypothetical protein n=1 Tax=Paeniroseomonas aquatica TaxID=373043 RepID=UPI003617F2B3
MLRSPEVADRFQKVGEYLRFGSSIPAALNELAILITARAWSAQYEWYAHHLLAMKAGLPDAVAQAVAEGRRPEGMDADQTVIWEFCTELHATNSSRMPPMWRCATASASRAWSMSSRSAATTWRWR